MDSNTIKDLDNFTLSQSERVSLKENVRNNMLLFLHTKLKRAIEGSDLKNKVDAEILKRLTDKTDPMNTSHLLDLNKTISGIQNQSEGKILDLLTSKEKNNDGEIEDRGEKEVGFSTEEMKEAQKMLGAIGSSNVKKFISMMDRLKDSEFSEEEKEN